MFGIPLGGILPDLSAFHIEGMHHWMLGVLLMTLVGMSYLFWTLNEYAEKKLNLQVGNKQKGFVIAGFLLTVISSILISFGAINTLILIGNENGLSNYGEDAGFEIEEGLILVKTDRFGRFLWNWTAIRDSSHIISVLETNNGSSLLLVTTNMGWSSGNVELFKINSEGTLEWHQTLGNGYTTPLVHTSDGNFLFGGYFSISDDWSLMLFKVDELGQIQWSQTIEWLGETYHITEVVETSDNGFLFAGKFEIVNSTGFYYSPGLVRLDGNGVVLWNQTFPQFWNLAKLLETNDGGYILIGETNDENSDFLIIKTDEWGTEQWNYSYGGVGTDIPSDAIVTSDGGYLISGTTDSPNPGFDTDTWIIKVDANGNEDWNQVYGGTEWEGMSTLIEISDDSYALVGSTRSHGSDDSNIWLVKIGSTGTLQWDQTYGIVKSEEYAYDGIVTSKGDYLILGTYFISNALI